MLDAELREMSRVLWDGFGPEKHPTPSAVAAEFSSEARPENGLSRGRLLLRLLPPCRGMPSRCELKRPVPGLS